MAKYKRNKTVRKLTQLQRMRERGLITAEQYATRYKAIAKKDPVVWEFAKEVIKQEYREPEEGEPTIEL